MTNKEVVKEMLKMIIAFELDKRVLTVKKRVNDEWVTLSQLKKEDVEQVEKGIIKLSQLEDTEKKFGIDFITFYEALTNGVWVRDEVGQIYHTYVYLHNLTLTPSSSEIKIGLFCFITPNNELLSFSRIKQDWALTREELE